VVFAFKLVFVLWINIGFVVVRGVVKIMCVLCVGLWTFFGMS